MLGYTTSGSFDNTENFLKSVMDGHIFDQLVKYGEMGVNALRAATPVDTGKTSESWTYEIKKDSSSWSIIWSNTNVVEGRPIAILLQYGHGTRNGGYVQGRDYINPAMRPIFDQMEQELWKAVNSA